MSETCKFPQCRSREIELIYLGKPLCLKHWRMLCRKYDEPQDIKKVLKIQ
ncbi:hypothetical protein LCGC14_0323040 [marine sediment metagenome]|uniref:Uncharacterized protein n=1 Tax=marine sediment metagenome TaxID=412755 RepID=A0A0F9TIJ5_9ZZZZ